MTKKVLRNLDLFGIMGFLYICAELLYRGYTHWTMFIVGGLCGLLCGLLNQDFTWDMSLVEQGFIGAVIITFLELVSGIILNLWLGLGIWDYSKMPFNILGQVCLPFTIIWFFFSIGAVILDDVLRWQLFDEEKPHYHLI